MDAKNIMLRLKLAFAFAFIPFSLLGQSTITVTTLDDNTTADGEVTLREAIEAANTNTVVDGSTAGTGADTIVFEAGLNGTITFGSAGVEITETLTIDGDNRITVSGNNVDGVFFLFVNDAGVDLTVRNITLTSFQDEFPPVFEFNGSANGTLTIENSTISNNENNTRSGGAIGIGNTANLVVKNSVFSSNTVSSSNSGGALHLTASGSTYSIEDSEFSNNSSQNGFGGAINASDGALTINRTIFSGNSADDGGSAIEMDGIGNVNILNSLFFENTTNGTTSGGTIEFFNHSADANIINSTITDNIDNGSVDTGGVLADNSAVTLSNTIIANNDGSETNTLNGGSFTGSDIGSGGDNIIRDSISGVFVDAANDDYDIQDGSLPVDAGNNTAATDAGLTTDINGNTRIVNSVVDIGAFENQTTSNNPPTTADADVFTVVNTEVAFSDSDFPFSDTDADDLQQIDIKTLPAGGTLYLDANNNDTNDGEGVSVNDVIPVADLQAGNLRYTPPSDATGYRAQNFTFRVNDGTDYSSSASTMNITMDAISVEIGDNGDDGEDNWHLISNPTNSNLTDLLSNVWTQGSANAKYTGGTPNVYNYDEVAQDYTGVPDLGTSPSAGTGHLVLFYADDDYASGGIQGDWPKPLSVTGTHNTSTVSIAAQNTDDDGSTTLTDDEGWNLIGNPFGTNISVGAVISALEAAFGSGEINSSVYIWDPDANSGDGGFVTRSSVDAIAAFQAFFVRLLTPGDSGNFDLDNSTRTSSATSILKEPEQNFPQLILAVNGTQISDQIRFHFTENGNLGIDRDDVFELSSLSSNYLQFFSLVGDQALAMNNLPNHLEEEITIPIYLKGTESGTFHLESTFESIPDQWHIQLENAKNGETINLRETTEFQFDYKSNIQKKETLKPVLSMSKAEQNHLFNLLISPTESSINEEVPESFTLQQNYPNPFNPTTQIEYSLPEQSRVSIKIYDMMGRQIDTLLSEQMPAGTHQITWNGENRSSGIYIYRLEAANRILTRKMTLIK